MIGATEAKTDSSRGVSVIVSVLVAVLGGGIIGAVLTYWSNSRQIDVKMIEIAVGVLSKEPTEELSPVRLWAIDVIDHYAERDVKLSPDVKSALAKFGYGPPAETVKVCDAFGTGWIYAPGLDTCVNLMTGETAKMTDQGIVRAHTKIVERLDSIEQRLKSHPP